MLDIFDINYVPYNPLNIFAVLRKDCLKISYKDCGKYLQEKESNNDNIYLICNLQRIVGLKIYLDENSSLEQYKNICLYDPMNCHTIPEDILNCFSWVIEKDYINKIRTFK